MQRFGPRDRIEQGIAVTARQRAGQLANV